MSMTNLTSDITWIKTNGFIKKKYGKSLSYRAIKLVTDTRGEFNDGFFYSAGEDLIIPLHLKNLNLGDIIVNRGSSLDQDQKLEVIDLIKFLMTPKIYSMKLKQTEENLRNLNTTPLFIGDSDRTMRLHEIKKTSKQTLSPVIFLKSQGPISRNKVSLKIHEMTERNLFVYMDDIAASIVEVNDFKLLNDITIYIEDIDQLSEGVFDIWQQYLELNLSEGPLFLVGSNLSLDAIKLKNWSESFKKRACSYYLDIDRVPFEQQMSEDVLELLFI